MNKMFEMTSMDELLERDYQNDILRRLRCVEGHVRGVARMIEEGESCPSVLRQVKAVQGALDKVGQILVREYLDQCVLNTLQDDESMELKRALTDLSEILIDVRSG
jgi:DNA-binding FrmR family transcriptional regulator